MSPPLLMATAALLFSLMGACVKLASAQYGTGEIVMYRSLVGVAVMAALLRWRGIRLATPVPAMHLMRSASGVAGLVLWFHAVGGLPLSTATALNYMSSVWIALFLLGGTVLATARPEPPDARLVAAVLAGFAGVALVLRPTFDQRQAWYAFAGLLSGLLAAIAYLQVTALGRIGEPEERVVLYFSIGGVAAGAAVAVFGSGFTAHTPRGAALLLATGLFAAGGQWTITRAYGRGATLGNAALQYLGIVFSFVLGVWWFDDPVGGQALAGLALIIAAGLAATLLRGRVSPADAGPTQY